MVNIYSRLEPPSRRHRGRPKGRCTVCSERRHEVDLLWRSLKEAPESRRLQNAKTFSQNICLGLVSLLLLHFVVPPVGIFSFFSL